MFGCEPMLRYDLRVNIRRRAVLTRLGFSKRKTVLRDHEEGLLDRTIRKVIPLTEPVVVYAAFPVESYKQDVVSWGEKHSFRSEKLVRMISGSGSLLLVGATIGAQIVEEISNRIVRGSAAESSILDAAASVAVDGLLDTLADNLAGTMRRKGLELTKHRFSPGYGGLDLSAQQIIYETLDFNRAGVELTESLMLTPEKSVLAIYGIKEI